MRRACGVDHRELCLRALEQAGEREQRGCVEPHKVFIGPLGSLSGQTQIGQGRVVVEARVCFGQFGVWWLQGAGGAYSAQTVDAVLAPLDVVRAVGQRVVETLQRPRRRLSQ